MKQIYITLFRIISFIIPRVSKIIPESVSENSIKGTAYISFYVMPDGRIDNFETVKTFSEDLSNNLIDTLRKMQEWIPGYHGGDPVVAKVCIPYQYGF